MALPELAHIHLGLREAPSLRTIAAGLPLWALCQQTLAFNPVEAECKERQTGQVLHVNGSGELENVPCSASPRVHWPSLAGACRRDSESTCVSTRGA